MLDIERPDMAADGAHKAQIYAPCPAGIAEAAVMGDLRVDQFDHLGAVAGFLVLAEYINAVPEFDIKTWRAPVGAHRLIACEYCPGHGMRRRINMHGGHLVGVGTGEGMTDEFIGKFMAYTRSGG